jgi:hypothetical protein
MRTKTQNNRVVAILALAGCFTLCAAAAATFTFKSGATFEGEVVEFKGTNMVIVRSAKDGNLYTITASALAGDGQPRLDELRAQHAKEQAEILAEQRRLAARRFQQDSVPAERAEDDSSGQQGHPSRITGAFGLKLGQVFDPKYATGTNRAPQSMTRKGELIQIEMVGYTFKPSHPVPRFERCEAGVTPCSNYVYSIAVCADFESFSAAKEEQEKLLAALQEKYGKATFGSWTNGVYRSWSYAITQGTREVRLTLSIDTAPISLFLNYEDTALHSQAKWEQSAIDAGNPERKLQRQKLENQL